MLLPCLVLQANSLPAEQVSVRYREGTTHGFLVLRDLAGKALAAGDLTQTVRGDNIVARLVFHFKDGSIDDEVTVFSQRGRFRLISDHHIQKGPAYPNPLNMLIDATTGCVTTRSESGGKESVQTERMKLPPDVANGMILYFLKNMSPADRQLSAHYVASIPKPRLIELAISEEDKETFDVANVAHQARHFVMKVNLGGITGIIAPLIGKAPADINLWVLDGDAPAFIRMEGQLYNRGPLWSIEMASPVWPKARLADH